MSDNDANAGLDLSDMQNVHETYGEKEVVPPAAEDARAIVFQDTSTECAICLEPFDEDPPTSTSILTLTCGHKWHYQCLVDQLQTAQPTPAQRLLFSGCQCAKCGRICDHPDLDHLTRTTDVLRHRVDVMLQEQLALDIPDVWKQVMTTSRQPESSTERQALMEQARRKYAFYLCSHCHEPYFGGTVECADQLDDHTSAATANTGAEERLCVACAPQSQVACRNPLEHQGYLVWKCRYCCRPSTHVCYGNVHFCDDCHGRNSQRVRQTQQQQQQQQLRSATASIKPPSLNPLPCPGASCPYPKTTRESNSNSNNNSNGQQQSNQGRQTHHSNGSTVASEQVYGCAWCQSISHHPHAQNDSILRMPGSSNLLQNPSGQQGLQGWRQLNRRISWQVEEPSSEEQDLLRHTMIMGQGQDSTLDDILTTTTTTNFVSSYLPCVMEQRLDLHDFCTLHQPQQARTEEDDDHHHHDANHSTMIELQVSARYRGRTDCPSVFALKAVLSDAQGRPLLQEATTTLDAPADYWERVSLQLSSSSVHIWKRARYVTVVVVGKDSRFWQGTFGSKVCDIAMRVLGSPEHLEWLGVSPEYQDRQESTIVGRDPPVAVNLLRQRAILTDHHDPQRDAIHTEHPRRGNETEAVIHQRRQEGPLMLLIALLRDGVLPILCLLLLAWLLQS